VDSDREEFALSELSDQGPSDLGVSPLVRRAWHGVGMARSAEALMLGLGAGLLAAAAAVASGGTTTDGTLWVVALIAALPMAAAWLIEMRPRVAAVARRIDRGLHLGGGLVAAWEVESHGRPGRLGLQLGRDLRRGLRVGAVLRVALPNSMPLVAAPLIGVAALVMAQGGRTEPVDPLRSVGAVIGGVTGALTEARDQALESLARGEVEGEVVEDLNRLLRDARDLSGTAGHLDDEPERREALVQGVRDLTRGLESALERQGAQPKVAGPLERALALADAAGLAGEGEPGPAASPENDPEHGSGSSSAEGSGPGDTLGALDTLAKDGAEGTMFAPSGQQGAPGGDSGALPTAPGAGTPGAVELGAWWPERHAGVLRRYLTRPQGADSPPD
jgi:hypothetical protein